MDADAEAEVPVALSVEDDLVGIGEDLGIAVGHRPRQPEPLAALQRDAVDFGVGGDGPAVARGRREEPQELLGRAVEKRVAVATEPLALVGMLGQPLQ